MNTVYAFDLRSTSPTFSNFDTLGQLVSAVVNNAFVLAGVVSFLMLIFGGFRYIIGAGGDGKQLEQGKKTITYAVFGLLLVFGSFLIIRIIETVGGVQLLN